MSDMKELLPCPFCGASAHRGLTKATTCQLHGEPLQNYRIWCPHDHASITKPSEALAIAAWNTRLNATPAPAGGATGPLSIISDWYLWLPKPAREKLSLHHLHTLAKRLKGAS